MSFKKDNTPALVVDRKEVRSSTDCGGGEDKNDATSPGDNNNRSIIPWEIIATFLPLTDVLNLRLLSHDCLDRVHEGLGPKVCAMWLALVLQERGMFVIGDLGKWRDATNRDTEKLENYCFESESSESSSTSPFDTLLRSMRVFRHVPEEAIVCYNGKYGRHVLGKSRQGVIKIYPQCSRGKKNCASCRVRIPSISMDEGLRPEGHEGIWLDEHFRIETGGGGMRKQLDFYYNKCIPNLPADLICPRCRVKDRRTLMLTEFSYKTEPGTERHRASNMALSFTPATTSQDSSRRTSEHKRARTEDLSTEALYESFPPKYREVFVPQQDFISPAMPDCKHGIAIHCDACRRFGVLAPANLLYVPSLEFHSTLQVQDGYQVMVGRCELTRAKCCHNGCDQPQCTINLGCSNCGKRFCQDHAASVNDCCGTTAASRLFRFP